MTTIQRADTGGARLAVEIRTPPDLGAADRTRMYQLMSDHFENIRREQFEHDLDEKRWVVTMVDKRRVIQGFSTQGILRVQLDSEEITAFFTGDTVIDPSYWGEGGWVRTLARLALAVADQMSGHRLYWLALTLTHRTYRLVPAFWREFYPNPDRKTPRYMSRRLKALVRAKFPDEYDAERGIVRLRQATPIRVERRQMASAGIDDRYGLFFRDCNPHFLEGDFLACIFDLSRANLTRLGRRIVNAPCDIGAVTSEG